jgi:hypothetical protein
MVWQVAAGRTFAGDAPGYSYEDAVGFSADAV